MTAVWKCARHRSSGPADNLAQPLYSARMAKKRARRAKSVASEMVKKSREAMLTAVQIFNNPQIDFKSELFIVTNTIAWTYLLHAYYRKKRVEYRRRKPGSTRFLRPSTARCITGAWRNASTVRSARSMRL